MEQEAPAAGINGVRVDLVNIGERQQRSPPRDQHHVGPSSVCTDGRCTPACMGTTVGGDMSLVILLNLFRASIYRDMNDMRESTITSV